MEVRISVMLRVLLGILGFTATICKWGGGTGEVQCFIFQDENPRSNLNWFCLAVVLLKALF
jgi:hypothetical protein